MTGAACPSLRDDETARRWVTGRLDAAGAAEFEVHLLGCARCQIAVEQAAALSSALRSTRHAPGHRGIPWPLLRWIAPVVLAAGLAGVVLWPRNPFARLADPGPPPSFGAAIVRSGTGEGAAGRGMGAYLARDYRATARLLASVPAAEAGPGVRFFLGVSLLLDGRAAAAVAPLAEAVGDGTTPYAAEASLWLAKAWLRLAQPDSALPVLRALGGRADFPVLSAHARALADSVAEAVTR